MGLLARVIGAPTIDTALLVGNIHTRTIYQAGGNADNTGDPTDYRSNGVVIYEANALISSLSGADGSGNEATYFMPVITMTQVIPLYLGTALVGNGAQSGIHVEAQHRGSYKIHRQDGSVVYSYTFDRDVGVIDSEFKQRFPTAWNLTGTGGGGSDAVFIEDFTGGYIQADVPINVIMNSNRNSSNIINGIETNSDEIVMYGTTPSDCRAEIRCTSDGRYRKRAISSTGAENWELT
jgi:hypothetical protein